MKKSMLLAGLILLFAAVAHAGATKYDLGNKIMDTRSPHAKATGFAVVNMSPNGTTAVSIQVQIRNAAPETRYTVKSGGVLPGEPTFVTNKNGHGGVHVNLEDDADLAGVNINVRAVSGNTLVLRGAL
ncbi:MAG: hypothetical protein JSU66_07340 [Deltaproteobacteria bacterium]|nr:MAG: hypothetical protein JSU66_07340 [Deltaproteobacteria bacterium]